MKTFVIGDIHGAYQALLQCLARSGFNKRKDRLIALGDVCDGWPQVKECVDELLTIPHLDYLMGNHDYWTINWALNGSKPQEWVTQGGEITLRSYYRGMPSQHIDFFENAKWWLIDQNRLFVHAGIDPVLPIEKQDKETLIWDRDLLRLAHRLSIVQPNFQFNPYREIYIGHTTTLVFHIKEPIQFCNVWAMDTGAGWSGKLSIMDIDTHEFWQSDLVSDLYPEERGRG